MSAISQSNWQFVLTDYQGNSYGPVIGATNRTFTHPISGMRTAGISMDIENPAAQWAIDQIQSSSPPLLKIYRKTRTLPTNITQLVFVGDVASLSVQPSSTEGASQVSIVAADGMWRLNKRFVGLGYDYLGRGTGYSYGSALSQVDLCAIISNLVTTTNGNDGPTGIINGLQGTSVQGYVGPLYAQNVALLIAQLNALAGGPDYDITPVEPAVIPGYRIAEIGKLNTYGSRATLQVQCTFDYGMGQNNVSTYSIQVDRSGQINQAVSLPQGYPDAVAAGDYVIKETDSTSQFNVGTWQDVVPGDVVSIPLRTQLCVDYVNVRRNPRVQLQFTPEPDNPDEYGVAWMPGDIAVARAQDQGVLIYTGTVRIYVAQFAIAEDDTEQMNLTLIPSPNSNFTPSG